MNTWSRFMLAASTGWQTGWQTARRVFEDPAQAYREQTFQQQADQYTLLWSYYNGAMFDRAIGAFIEYRKRYNLYRNIRMIYNPVRRLVDFYSGAIYPGVLSEDGSMLPDGVPLAIPFSEDTDPALKSAVAQFWQWTNWQSKKSLMVRYGAALGSVLVEVVDDLARGKVTTEIVWPGFITDLELDAAGNVKAYTLEYQASDEQGLYQFKKEVDQDAIRYYRNNEPFDYGNGAVVANIYGFVPAVWIKHADLGGDHGSPVIAGSLSKIDELNNLAAHVHDQIHKVIGAPVVIWSGGGLSRLFNQAKRTTNEFSQEQRASEQENLLMLEGAQGGRVDSLAGNLSLSDSLPYMSNLLSEIEQDHPELVFFRELRNMSQLTGPAASRIAGDVSSRVTEAGATYDNASMKIFQMATAIAGYRASTGAWGELNDQQKKFEPFNLESYQRGQLNMAIMPRPLLTPTKLEVAQEKQALWQAVKSATDAGVPLELALQDEGWTDKEILRLQKLKDEAAQRSIALMQQQTAASAPAQQSQNEQQSSQDQKETPFGQSGGKQ